MWLGRGRLAALLGQSVGVLYVPDSVLLSILQASKQLRGKRALLLFIFYFIYLFVFETRFHSEA